MLNENRTKLVKGVTICNINSCLMKSHIKLCVRKQLLRPLKFVIFVTARARGCLYPMVESVGVCAKNSRARLFILNHVHVPRGFIVSNGISHKK